MLACSFTADADSCVIVGDRFLRYLAGLGVTGVKGKVATSRRGSLPTPAYAEALRRHAAHGMPTMLSFDRGFAPVCRESARVYPNMALDASGDHLLSPYIDDWTLRAAGFLRVVKAREAIAWNEGNGLGVGLEEGDNPAGLKANAVAPAVLGAIGLVAARRWRHVGVERVYLGALSLLPSADPSERNPFVYAYLDAMYRSLERYHVGPPWPWAGISANIEGWWTAEHLAAELAAVRAVMAKHGDRGEIILGEWGTTNAELRAAPHLLAPTLAAVQGSGHRAWLFQLPGKDPHEGDPARYADYGCFGWGSDGHEFVPTCDYDWGRALRARVA